MASKQSKTSLSSFVQFRYSKGYTPPFRLCFWTILLSSATVQKAGRVCGNPGGFRSILLIHATMISRYRLGIVVDTSEDTNGQSCWQSPLDSSSRSVRSSRTSKWVVWKRGCRKSGRRNPANWAPSSWDGGDVSLGWTFWWWWVLLIYSTYWEYALGSYLICHIRALYFFSGKDEFLYISPVFDFDQFDWVKISRRCQYFTYIDVA